jgi:hypothetical protein
MYMGTKRAIEIQQIIFADRYTIRSSTCRMSLGKAGSHSLLKGLGDETFSVVGRHVVGISGTRTEQVDCR